jgi:hypothetical protein
VANSRGVAVPAKNLFRTLKPGECKVLENKRKVCGVELYVIGMLLPDSSEFLIVVADKEPETALEDYAKRWEIETLFGCLKKKGFDFGWCLTCSAGLCSGCEFLSMIFYKMKF